MNILRPEQRPDKNGKIVTRHVKDGSGKSPSAALNVPPTLGSASKSQSRNPLSALKDRKERKAHEKEQRKNLSECFDAYVGFDEASAELLVMSIHQPESVDKALALVEQFESFGGSVGGQAVKDLLRTVDMDRALEGESSGLRAMYAHREYFDRNPFSVGMFAMGFVFLKERELDGQQEDGRVPALENIVNSANELARVTLNSGRKHVDTDEFFTKATFAAGLKQRAARGQK